MMPSTRWTRAGALAGLVVGTAFLFACGGSSTTSQAPAAQPPAAGPAATPASGPTATASPVAQPPAAASPGVTQEHETGAEITLVEVRRTSGDSLTVKWRYKNATAQAIVLSKGGTAWSEPYALTAGTFVIDPVNKKKYLVITDEQKYPLSSKHGDWQGVTLAPGQTLSAWAKLPAPPPEVEKVTVTVPGAPPFEDAPVVK